MMRSRFIQALGRRRTADALVRHLLFLMVVKLVVLGALWFAFFHTPAGRDLNAATVGQALVGESGDFVVIEGKAK